MWKISSLEEFWSVRTFLLFAYIGLLMVGFIAFSIKARRDEMAGTRGIHLGYGLFGLTYGLTRVFFLMSDYESAINVGLTTKVHLLWVTGAYSITFVSLAFIYWAVEKHILSRKPVFTSLSAGMFALCIVALVLTALEVGLDLATNAGPHRIAQFSLYIVGPILAAGITLLYARIAATSTGQVRTKAILSFLGLIILFVGLVLDMDLMSTLLIDEIRFIVSPVAFMTGTIMFFYAQR